MRLNRIGQPHIIAEHLGQIGMGVARNGKLLILEL